MSDDLSSDEALSLLRERLSGPTMTDAEILAGLIKKHGSREYIVHMLTCTECCPPCSCCREDCREAKRLMHKWCPDCYQSDCTGAQRGMLCTNPD